MSNANTARRVAFLGLGVMGFPMAGHLAAAGHQVRVYNRTAAKARRFTEQHGGSAHTTPADAALQCDAVFACLGDDSSVREVLLGEQGALSAAARGALFVDHTTASASLARELAQVGDELGVEVVDAPVSGGEVGAQTGALSIMAGGSADGFARADAIWRCYAKSATHIGPAGSGQQAKMVNQVCIAGVLKGLCEGIALLEATGLSPERVFEAIGGGAAQSWQMNNRALTMVRREFDFGFAVDWMRKDLGLAMDEARRHGVRLPLTEQVDADYARVQARGGARYDTSSLLLAQDHSSRRD
jgi:3-hydroxyisobutyrate dehydrogenase-like beta-hydroxyacid dehydrogenase